MPNKIKAGFFSFTEILDGRHREYNRWHLFDQMPEQLTLKGLPLAQCWVATPELVDRRVWADGAIGASHYLTLYLMMDPVDQVLDEFAALSHDLQAAGPSVADHRGHLSGPFTLVKTVAAPGVVTDADAIPYRPNRGVFVTVQDHAVGATDAGLAEARDWYDRVHIPDLLSVQGAVGCWCFEALTDTVTPGAEPNPGGRTIRVYWLDEDPVSFHEDLRARTRSFSLIDLSKAYDTSLVASFRTIPADADFDWFD